MSRKWVIAGVGLAIVVVLLFGILIPSLQPRCQRWYHQVGSVARQHINGVGSGSIPPEVWDQAVTEVGAKPFYCN